MNEIGIALQESLKFEIHNPTIDGLKRLVTCEKALKDLLALKITVSDFCEILAANGIDIDNYLDVIDRNLSEFGL